MAKGGKSFDPGRRRKQYLKALLAGDRGVAADVVDGLLVDLPAIYRKVLSPVVIQIVEL
jgi:hypothetical protein